MSPIKWVLMLAPLAFVFGLSAMVYRMSAGMAQMMFWIFAAVMGASLSSIFIVYTPSVDRAGVLHQCGSFRWPQPLWLHHEEGPLRLGFIPDHGCDRHRNCCDWLTCSCSHLRFSSQSL